MQLFRDSTFGLITNKECVVDVKVLKQDQASRVLFCFGLTFDFEDL